jgi:hypothetical protein
MRTEVGLTSSGASLPPQSLVLNSPQTQEQALSSQPHLQRRIGRKEEATPKTVHLQAGMTAGGSAMLMPS